MTFNHFNELTQHLQTNIYEFDNTYRESFNKVLNLSKIESYIYKLTKASNTLLSLITQDFEWQSLKPSEYVNTINNSNSPRLLPKVKIICLNYQPTYSSKKKQKYNRSFSNRYKQQNQRRTHHWK